MARTFYVRQEITRKNIGEFPRLLMVARLVNSLNSSAYEIFSAMKFWFL